MESRDSATAGSSDAESTLRSSDTKTTSIQLTSGSGTPRESPVWKFFSTSPDTVSIAVCNLCKQRLSRGRPGTRLGTSALIRHMRRHHPILWEKQQRSSPRHCRSKTRRTSMLATHSDQSSSGQDYSMVCSSDEEEMEGPNLELSTSSSKAGQPHPHHQQENCQLPIMDCLDRKQKYAPGHPLVRQLNGHVVKLLVMESLPYQLVDSSAFQKLMECAQPQWRLPSSHYFTKKAVPELYTHVAKNVAHSLDFSLCTQVHATVNSWSNSHDQEQYLSFTIHWVNLAASSEDMPWTQRQQVELVMPPRIVRTSSEAHCLSLSQDYSPSPIAIRQSDISPPPYHTCMVKRCHAVLHLSLEDRTHTVSRLLACIQQQNNRWFSPRLLQVGNVVSNSGQNIVSALRLGKLTHVPCFAHILSLVVHTFIKSYPGLGNVLGMARKVCSYFSKSYAARDALLDLQRSNGLPLHGLICDVPTQWNSTLQMLDRLYQLRKAVNDYIMHHGTKDGSVCFFEPSQWLLIRDTCHLLRPFEEATRFVSRDNCGMNDVIPLIFILEKAVALLQQGKGEDQVQCLTRCRVPFVDLFGGDAGWEDKEGQHFMDLKEEEEEGQRFMKLNQEEDEIVSLTLQFGDEADPLSSGHTSGDHEDDNDEGIQWGVQNEATSDSDSERVASMARCMLSCLRKDKHIIDIKQREDYWVSTLLDPRYKSKMGEFFQTCEQDAKLRHYQTALCTQLVSYFIKQEPPSLDSRDESSLRSTLHRHSTNPSSSCQYSLIDIMENFFQPTHLSDAPNQSHKQHLEKMVMSYLDCPTVPDTLSRDPLNYWVSKLDQWPELAQFAIQVLACPASSVLSERAFSTAGNIVTPKCTKLSSTSVERLTFIKMNPFWISDNFQPPLPDTNE